MSDDDTIAAQLECARYIADNFAAIRARLDEIYREQPDWMPKCRLCSDTGWRRFPTGEGWRRVVCPQCGNPEGKP